MFQYSRHTAIKRIFQSNGEAKRLLAVKVWVCGMKVIKAYLPIMDEAHPKFMKQKLVQNCIAPNIPEQLRLTFCLSWENLVGTVHDVLFLLKDINWYKPKTKKRESNNQLENKGEKKIKTTKTIFTKGKANIRNTRNNKYLSNECRSYGRNK